MKTQQPNLSILALDCRCAGRNKEPDDLRNAFQTVRTLAESFGSRVLATSVFSPGDFRWPVQFEGDDGSAFSSIAEDRLQEFMSETNAGFDYRAAFHHRAAPADEVRAIRDVADREQANAIFVLTHIHDTRTGFTNELVKATRLPVLAINAAAAPVKTLKTIVFATDFSLVSQAAHLVAREIAKKSGAKLVVFHRIESPFAAGIEDQARQMRSRDQADGIDSTFVTSRCYVPVTDAIISKCEQHQADLLVMGLKPRRPPFHSVGGVVTRVLAKSRCPVLLLSEQASLTVHPSLHRRLEN